MHSIIRLLPIALGLTVCGQAVALGLGELRNQPVLGEPLRLQIELLGDNKTWPDERCFRLIPPPATDELPWLKQASFRVRPGKPPLLELTAAQYVNEPVLQLSVQVGCGHEVTRTYLLLASPPRQQAALDAQPGSEPSARQATPAKEKRRTARSSSEAPGDSNSSDDGVPVKRPATLPKRPARAALASPGLPDRLQLTMPDDDGLPLHFSGQLSQLSGLPVEAAEAQREILRLEYRMLTALHEQATSQLAVAEKLREMEATLALLQQRSDQATHSLASSPSVVEPKLTPAAPVQLPAHPVDLSPSWGDWVLYGGLGGALLGVLGWLFWKRRETGWRGDDEFADEQASSGVSPALVREESSDPSVAKAPPLPELAPEALDLHFDGGDQELPLTVDLELDGGDESPEQQKTADSMTVEFMTPDNVLPDRPEANPVMELADIMLSFGRVKGAAQALQEYIDNNPQEALQPWIRLMDVYRMAGMRDEFETVARNLNQHFNVAVQAWEQVPPSNPELSLAVTPEAELGLFGRIPLPQSLEEMPRIMNVIVEMWPDDEVLDYLHELLRDNRGGQRAGFTMPVVEELLFLVELRETVNRLADVEHSA